MAPVVALYSVPPKASCARATSSVLKVRMVSSRMRLSSGGRVSGPYCPGNLWPAGFARFSLKVPPNLQSGGIATWRCDVFVDRFGGSLLSRGKLRLGPDNALRSGELLPTCFSEVPESCRTDLQVLRIGLHGSASFPSQVR